MAATLVVLYFILQLQSVQNWLIGIITRHLSAELETKVEIRHVDIEFFDNLLLEGVYIQDLQGDTLLYAEKLSAGLNSNIFTLFRNKLEFNEIALKKARFYLKRPEGTYDSNIKFLLDYFSGPSSGKKKKQSPFSIRVQKLRLDDVIFLQDDRVRGERRLFQVGHAFAKVRNFDLGSNVVDVGSLDLDGFYIDLDEDDGKPMPPRPKKIRTAQDSLARLQQAPLRFNIDRFSLKNGRFSLDKNYGELGRSLPPEVMDYDHLHVQNIEIQADSVQFDDNLSFTGVLKRLSGRERCGFELTQAQAGKVVVNDTLTALYQTKIETGGGSRLGDTVCLHYSQYRDFRRFVGKVTMDLRLDEGSKLRLGDMMHFDRHVAENSFFIRNKATVADVRGNINGRVGRLNGRNLNIRVNDKTFIQCDFDGNDMDEGPEMMQLHFRIKRLQSDIASIGAIIPDFNPPSAFFRLGNIAYEGEYDFLFGYDHILTGQVISDIGSGKIDMKLNLAEGRDKASYSGNLNMRRFDLSAWTGDKDFGNTSFNITIAEGSSGLRLNTMNARLIGVVDTLNYKGYNYRNLEMNGAFKENVFEGKAGIEDPNIDFGFDGTINFRDSILQFLFKAEVKRLDLGALNLSQEDLLLSASIPQMRLRAGNINDLAGTALVRDVRILQDRQTLHKIDSIRFSSGFTTGGEYSFDILSDILYCNMTGRYRLGSAPNNLLRLFYQYHPELAAKAGFKTGDSSEINDRYVFNAYILNTKGLTQIIDENLDTLKNIAIRISVDALRGETQVSMNAPQLRYGNVDSKRIEFNWSGRRETGQYRLSIPYTTLGGAELDSISAVGWVNRNELGLKMVSKNTGEIPTRLIKGVDFDGVLSIVDSLWQIRFNASELSMFGQNWVVSEDNYIRFSDRYLDTRDFELFSGDKRILLESRNEGRGLWLSFTNFNLDLVNRYIGNKNLQMRGTFYDFEVEIEDVFQQRGINGYINSDTVFINNIPYGTVTGNIEMPALDSAVSWKMFLNYQNRQLRVAGAWLPEGNSPIDVPWVDVRVNPGEFQTNVDATALPMSILETFVPGISKTAGQFRADVSLGGPFNKVAMNGYAFIEQAQFQIDYLKTMYHLSNQRVELSRYRIWVDSARVYDARGVAGNHAALVRGGLIHDHFAKWRIDCKVKSLDDNFMVLNTLPEDNPSYYGQAIGSLDAVFSGTFDQTNIEVSARTGKDSRLYIPLSGGEDVKEVKFINFIDKNAEDTLKNNRRAGVGKEVKGLNLLMNISITEQAEVQLIFDEQAGDIIKSRGEGNIRLAITREGEFKMYGSYRIRRGEYLFTLLNFVNKPFTVKDGGSIDWFGDPYSAKINIDASYEELTSPYNLIRDEVAQLGSAGLDQEAQKAIRTVVNMHLKGELLKPSVSFDLEFPNATPQIRSVLDNKIRLLRQDPNEMNRQVFGLVVVGSFLPSNSSQFIQSSAYLSTTLNTLTQVLSNQFSNFLSSLAAEWFGRAVSSIDFDVAYNEYESTLNDPAQSTQVGRELQVRLTSGFANDRISLQLGSQIGIGNQGVASQSGFLGEDVTLEIQLTENRQWRLKIYQRTEPDIVVGQIRSRYGLGLSFRKEFNTFDGMMEGIGKWFKKQK